MLKLIGAILILSAAISGGRLMAARLKRRCTLLYDLQQGLLCLLNQISYGALPLRQALAAAASAAGGAEPVFAAAAAQLAQADGRTAGEIWQSSLALLDGVLTEEDRRVLRSIGAELGLTGREEQVQRLELLRLRLAGLEQEARASAGDFVKLWRSLGAAGGVVLVLLFL